MLAVMGLSEGIADFGRLHARGKRHLKCEWLHEPVRVGGAGKAEREYIIARGVGPEG
jgi:hypothetical protein